MNKHVDLLIADCSNSLYALNILRYHGMTVEGLREVFRAKILSRFTYAAPAWWGFALLPVHGYFAHQRIS